MQDRIAFEEKGSGGRVAALPAANLGMRTELQIKAEAAGARLKDATRALDTQFAKSPSEAMSAGTSQFAG